MSNVADDGAVGPEISKVSRIKNFLVIAQGGRFAINIRTGHVDHVDVLKEKGFTPSVLNISLTFLVSPAKSTNVSSTCRQAGESATFHTVPSRDWFSDHHVISFDRCSVPNILLNRGIRENDATHVLASCLAPSCRSWEHDKWDNDSDLHAPPYTKCSPLCTHG